METDTARILTFYTVFALPAGQSRLTQKWDQSREVQVSTLTMEVTTGPSANTAVRRSLKDH